MTAEMIVRDATSYNLADTMKVGDILAKSGFFADSREAAQAFTKILAGQEMGIGPIAAMTGIFIVKGRVTLSANLMAAQVKRSGRYNYRVTRLDDTGCEIAFFEGQTEIGRSSFTADDAKSAGLWNSSDPWKKTPRNMFFARAISNGVKWFTPDVFSGPVYTPDELSNDTPAIDTPPPSPARAALPPAPPVNVSTGEVTEKPMVAGAVSGVKLSTNAAGETWIGFSIGGTALVAKALDFPGIEYLENGDYAQVTYQPTKARGKVTNIASMITGEETPAPWEYRATEAAEQAADGGATFTPIEVPEEEPA